ncbi:phosphatidyl inositol kinase [Phlyctochytrium bullatum]|nr:phosphatidyl inositol kinase [Phlyctochytrium bullatum]
MAESISQVLNKVAKAVTSSSQSTGSGRSASLLGKKKQKTRKPSRNSYTAINSNPTGGTRTAGYSLENISGDPVGGGDEWSDDDDNENDDVESLSSIARSDDRLFSPQAVPSAPLGRSWASDTQAFSSTPSDQTFLLHHNSPILAPSLLPDSVLPQEPLFYGAGALVDSVHPLTSDFANSVPRLTPVSSEQFLAIVEDVRAAIAEGIYPARIAKGSSGSYFCRNRAGEIVGVFKPKNEEPYGKMNPKWTKWVHRNLLPCCFGRSCLIPNLGYISEAAASYIDRRLGLNVVPRTEVVALASPTFFYSAKVRWEYRRGKPLPPKLGSFQLFLRGFKDATTFFKEGYDRLIDSAQVGPAGPAQVTNVAENSVKQQSISPSGSAVSINSAAHPYNWSERTQREFQWGFERLVVLDYLIRNTDRGLDNWMIRYNHEPVLTGTMELPGSPVLINGSKFQDSNLLSHIRFIDITSGKF